MRWASTYDIRVQHSIRRHDDDELTFLHIIFDAWRDLSEISLRIDAYGVTPIPPPIKMLTS